MPSAPWRRRSGSTRSCSRSSSPRSPPSCPRSSTRSSGSARARTPSRWATSPARWSSSRRSRSRWRSSSRRRAGSPGPGQLPRVRVGRHRVPGERRDLPADGAQRPAAGPRACSSAARSTSPISRHRGDRDQPGLTPNRRAGDTEIAPAGPVIRGPRGILPPHFRPRPRPRPPDIRGASPHAHREARGRSGDEARGAPRRRRRPTTWSPTSRATTSRSATRTSAS